MPIIANVITADNQEDVELYLMGVKLIPEMMSLAQQVYSTPPPEGDESDGLILHSLDYLKPEFNAGRVLLKRMLDEAKKAGRFTVIDENGTPNPTEEEDPTRRIADIDRFFHGPEGEAS